MLSSITPLGERGRRARWPVTVAFYITGSVLGGVLVGAMAGGLGQLLSSFVRLPLTSGLVIVAVAALVCAAMDTDRLRGHLPTIHRQVNEDWLDTYRSWVYGTGFGLQLGMGVVTIVTTAAVYLLGLVALLSGSIWVGLSIGALFGLARALPALRLRSVTTPDRLASLFRRLSAAEPHARATTIAGQATVALAAATVAVMAG